MPSILASKAIIVVSLLCLPPLIDSAGARAHSFDNPMLAERIQRVDIARSTKWKGAMRRARELSSRGAKACGERVGGDCRLDDWQDVLERAGRLPRAGQMRAVQDFVNRTAYRSDREVWGHSDYWAAPGEFFARGGDCEDYAIAKYLSLKQLGFPVEDLRVLVLEDTARGVAHAVLLVQFAGTTLVLDNLRPRIMTWDELPQYRPLYSVNEIDFWLYRRAAA